MADEEITGLVQKLLISGHPGFSASVCVWIGPSLTNAKMLSIETDALLRDSMISALSDAITSHRQVTVYFYDQSKVYGVEIVKGGNVGAIFDGNVEVTGDIILR